LEPHARKRFRAWPARIKSCAGMSKLRNNPKTTDMARRKLTREELHDWIEREFHASGAHLCGRCRVPLPVFRQGMKEPNWRLPAAEECPALCHIVLAEIVSRAAERYDLAA
jgi:hypothetical protein